MTIVEAEPPDAEKASVFARRGGTRLHECSIELEVPFHDVDALRVVWHGHYYKYMEIARTQLLRSLGLDATELVALRHGLLVIESGCRYVSPLCYGDHVRVSAWLRDVKHRIFVGYELENLTTGVSVARGHTVLVTTTHDGQMLHRTPAPILKLLMEHADEDDSLRDGSGGCPS